MYIQIIPQNNIKKIIESKIFKALAFTFLFWLNFFIAGVAVGFAFFLIIFIASYAAVKGALFKKIQKTTKAAKIYNVLVNIARYASYGLVILLTVLLFVQIVFKIFY